MKRTSLTFAVISCFFLTSQVGNNQAQGMEEPFFDYDLFLDYYENISWENSTSWARPDPCSTAVQGLNVLAEIITYIVVFVLGVVGNSVVIYVVLYMGRYRVSTDVYLMHLALADLLFSLTLPFWAVYRRSGWIFGIVLCKLLSGLQEASFYCGVFLLACISFDRYLAIVRATQTLSPRCRLEKFMCGVVWLVGIVLSLPVVFQREPIEHGSMVGQQMICYENLTGDSSQRWRVGIRVLRHVLGFFVPLLVMGFCYATTVVTLLRARNAKKHKALRVILAVVLAFVICWLPYNIAVLVDTLMRGELLVETCEVRNTVDLMLSVTELMAFMHCAVNPVLYAFIGQKFRNQLLKALHQHGLISKRVEIAYRKGSAHSAGSSRSRNTSVTL